MAENTDARSQVVEGMRNPTYLPPDDIDIRLLLHGELPLCPFCAGTPSTLTKYFEHSGIYQGVVHCSRCLGQVLANTRNREDAREQAITIWKTRAPQRNPLNDAFKALQKAAQDVLDRGYVSEFIEEERGDYLALKSALDAIDEVPHD